jgi:predicted RNA-binding protein (virulence factor B family)
VRSYCFVYLDHEERPVATTLEPYILLNEFTLVKNYVNQIGALDWGMEKTFWFPFKEHPMEKKDVFFTFIWMKKQIVCLLQVRRINFLKMKSLLLKKEKK